MKHFYPFLVALQFLTRLPASFRSPPGEAVVARSVVYYPLVGLLLGALIAAMHALLADAPAAVRAVMVLIAWVTLTGGLHLDGLADTADAWAGGGRSAERTLALMKDPHCGPLAVVALMLVLLLKFACLQTLAPGAWPMLLLIPALSRAAIPLLFATTPYLRPQGMGRALARTPASLPAAAVIMALPGLAAIAVGGVRGVVLLLTAFGAFALLRYAMMKRIGGTTGDTAGGLIELSETALIASLVLP